MYVRLWLPAMLSALGWALSDMADAVVVGRRLGTVGLAAIGLILPVYMVNCLLAHGLGLGGSARYARMLGRGDRAAAGRNFVRILWAALALSAATAVLGTLFLDELLALLGTTPADGPLFWATRDYLRILVPATPLFYLSNLLNYYLRNDGSQNLAGAGSLVGNLSDIALNVTLVLGLDMGTAGAALSTAVGQVISIAIYLPGLFRRGGVLRPGLPDRGWLGEVRAALASGMSTSVQYLYQMVFFLLCNNLLIRMGGAEGVAVFDLLQNTSYLILYLYEGTARAMQPLLSTYLGEHNTPGRRRTAQLGFATGMGAGGLLILCILLWPGGMCTLFGVAGTAAEGLARLALRIYALGAVFAGANILVCSYCQACGRERAAFAVETLRGAALLLPLALLFSRLGLGGFWWLFPTAEGGALAIFLLWARGKELAGVDLPAGRVFQRTISSSAAGLGQLTRELERFCAQWGATARQRYFVTMAAEELGLAILRFGFAGREDGYLQITAAALPEGLFELHIRDDAVSFDPFRLETNRAQAGSQVNLDAMGVLVVKEKAKRFSYRRCQGFNTLSVTI